MKIGYVAGYDATDVRHWSGTGFNIWRSLARQGHEILHFQPPLLPQHLCGLLGLADRIIRKLSHRRYLSGHSVLVARYQAKKTDQWVAAHPDIDAILSPGTIPVAFMRPHMPLITWSDATHRALFNTYPEFKDISRVSHWEGDQIERASLRRASAAMFSADWAAKSAVRDYGAPQARIHVVPFGANLDEVPNAPEIPCLIESRLAADPQLLFVGVDWVRKGGNDVVRLAQYLRAKQCNVSLRIIGCIPPEDVRDFPWVITEGFIDKRSEEGRSKLDTAFRSASLLVVPSLAECYGLVYCEANAYAVPAIGCDVGGVPTIVRDGENGLLIGSTGFTVEDGVRILALLRDNASYATMAINSRRAYDEQFNWNIAGRRASEIIAACVASRQKGTGA